MLKKASVVFIVVFAVFFFAVRHASAGDGRTLRVAAASDLTYALREIAAAFEKESGTTVVVSYGSSGALSEQIDKGAPFDVFLSADAARAERLAARGGVMPDTLSVYAKGVIVMAYKDGGRSPKTLRDLLSPSIKRIAIANPSHAPYGRAAIEALISEGIMEVVKDKLVYGENVRQAMQYLERGEVDAAIIARSIADVRGVSFNAISASSYKTIAQTSAVVSSTKEEALARGFLDYMKKPATLETLKKYGFILP